MKYILILLLTVLSVGCETPYSGNLGPGDFNGWIQSEEDGFVCLANGFDELCLRTIPGPQGIQGDPGVDGQDGIDGERGPEGQKGDTVKGDTGKDGNRGFRGFRGPQGIQGDPGVDGQDGKDGADGKDGKTTVVVETVGTDPASTTEQAYTTTGETCETCGQPIVYVSPPVTTTYNPPPISTPAPTTPPVEPPPLPDDTEEVVDPPASVVSTIDVHNPFVPDKVEDPDPIDVVEDPDPVEDPLPAACGRWTTDLHEHDNSGLVSDYSAEQDRRDLHSRLGRRFREYYDVDEYSCGFHYHGDDQSDAHRHSSRANY